MSIYKYILDEKGNPVACDDLMAWAVWFETAKRMVDFYESGTVKVSTVFLGLDHNYLPDGPAVLWETMVFGGKHDQHQEHCSGSREQAEAMHAKVVAMVKL